MKIMVSREVRIVDAFKVFPDTIAIYQDAVSFLIDVVNEHYVNVCGLPSQKAMTFVERLVHSTSTREAVYPSFDIRFHKLPSYLRRSAIFDAIAAIKLYGKNLAEWEVSDKLRKKPFLKRNRNVMPAFYRDNMFILEVACVQSVTGRCQEPRKRVRPVRGEVPCTEETWTAFQPELCI